MLIDRGPKPFKVKPGAAGMSSVLDVCGTRLGIHLRQRLAVLDSAPSIDTVDRPSCSAAQNGRRWNI
jgi:hypothetical protein